MQLVRQILEKKHFHYHNWYCFIKIMKIVGVDIINIISINISISTVLPFLILSIEYLSSSI